MFHPRSFSHQFSFFISHFVILLNWWYSRSCYLSSLYFCHFGLSRNYYELNSNFFCCLKHSILIQNQFHTNKKQVYRGSASHNRPNSSTYILFPKSRLIHPPFQLVSFCCTSVFCSCSTLHDMSKAFLINNIETSIKWRTVWRMLNFSLPIATIFLRFLSVFQVSFHSKGVLLIQKQTEQRLLKIRLHVTQLKTPGSRTAGKTDFQRSCPLRSVVFDFIV